MPTAPRAPDRPPPVARAVLQPSTIRPQWGRVLTPTRTWEWVKGSGFFWLDADRHAAVGGFFSTYPVSAVALLPGGEDVVVLWNDPHLAHDAEWHPLAGAQQRTLERWSLVTRKRLWSRALPPVTAQLGFYQDALGHIAAGARGLFVTRCYVGKTASCEILPVSAADGTLGAPSIVTGGPMPGSQWWNRIDSKSGRFSIEQWGALGWTVTGRAEEPGSFSIFDDEGRTRGWFLARCARFDEQDRLRTAGLDERTRPALQALGIEAREDRAACVPVPQPSYPPDIPLDQTGLLDQSRPVVAGHHVLWQLQYLDRKAFSFDTASPSLPARFALPPDDPKTPDARWSLAQTSPHLCAFSQNRYACYKDVAAAPETGALPHGGFLWARGDAFLAGHWPPGDDSYFRLDVGLRPAPDKPLAWRSLEATSNYFPAFALTGVPGKGGASLLSIAGGSRGFQRVDPASGRVLSRTCTTPPDSAGKCARDKFVGLVTTSDGARAYTFHSEQGEIGKNPETRFLEIDLATGKIARSFPAPYFSFEGPDSYAMGWIEPDRRFWLLGNLVFPSSQTCIVTVTLPTAPSGEASLSMACVDVRALAITGDPAGRYFAVFHPRDTVDFHAPDGEQVLLVGTRGDDAFAQTRDGRFACTGAACDQFRCILDDEVRPITDPACQSLRAPGFSLEAELAKPR